MTRPILVRRRRAVPAILLAVLAGCQSAAPSGAPVGSGDLAGTPLASPGAAGSLSPDGSGGGPDIPADMLVGAGDVVLGDPTTGLAELASHRAVLTMAFDGAVDGTARRWTSTTTLTAAHDPLASVLSIEITGDAPEADTAPPPWQAREAGVAHEQDDAGTCTTRLLDVDEAPLDEPAAALPGIFGGAPAGSETLAGSPADVVTFDAAALGYEPGTEVTGKVWLAAGSELILRYASTIKGADAAFGERATGTLTTTYELTDIGAAVPSIPVGCAPGLVDAPKPGDAAVVTNGPGLLTFTTAATVKDVAAFYADAAPGLGWQPAEANVFTKVAILKFTRQGLLVEIVATSDGDHTTVRVITDRAA